MTSSFRTPHSAFRNKLLSRRELIKRSSLGMLGATAAPWFGELAARAALPSSGTKPITKSCILLYMSGGPSHIDTFDPKPDNGSFQFKSIPTRIPGVHFVENLPKLAAMADGLAVLRGMSTLEADHGRARYSMHTGYRQGVGGLIHPSLGAIVSSQLGDAADVLPNFVSIDSKNTGRANGAGYAGPMHAPLEMTDPEKGVQNLAPRDDLNGFARRMQLFGDMERNFVDRLRSASAEGHAAMYQRAVSLMHSPKVAAFDLSQESAKAREAYGGTPFGDGCLLARRLIESGVKFVEVVLDGWDTHQDNLNETRRLSNILDPAMAALLADLKDRGRLESTLVVCMGEFGRSPGVEGVDGRGHYAKAWSTVLAGGGLKTGQVVGATDDQGATVVDHPIGTIDFLATVCKALEIDYTKNFTTGNGRPMRIVDKNEKLVEGLF